MKQILPSLLLAALVALSQPAAADSTFLDIGIVNPDIESTRLQLFPDDDVEGLRFGLINIENGSPEDKDKKGNVSGISLSAIATGTKGDFNGIQVAGLRNRVDGKFAGIELSLFWNQHFDRAEGLLMSVFANTAYEIDGLSWALFCNWSEALDGWQSGPAFFVPSFFNRAGGETDGETFGCVQFGFVNVHGGEMNGSQALTCFFVPSLVNIADNVNGIQFGFVNVGGDVRGIQFGLFNMARRLFGIQIGLSNYIGEEFNTAGFHWLPVFNIAAMSF